MMDESQYLRRVDAVFRCIQDGCDAIDPDLVEAYVAGDVLTLTFADRSRCVVNTQRPTRQVWLAAGTRAWHFSLLLPLRQATNDSPPRPYFQTSPTTGLPRAGSAPHGSSEAWTSAQKPKARPVACYNY
jgi:iron donor protein CyaY